MIWPKKLKDGDKVLLTSFSSTSTKLSDLKESIERFERENNLKVHLDTSLLGTTSRHENLSKYRQKMTNCIDRLDLDDISALFSICGGWSITDILLNNKVDLDNLIQKIVDKRAVVLGYSDNTLLSDYINLAYGYVTYHAPNFEGFYSWSDESQLLVSKLLKERFDYKLDLMPINNGRSTHEESGILISSNLECLTLSLAFTDKIKKEFKDHGVILLLEDTLIEPSLAFRYLECVLMRFKNEGIPVKAIIFGTFFACKEISSKSWQDKSFWDVLPHLIQHIDIPIFATDKVGHVDEGETDSADTSSEGEDHYLTTPSGDLVQIKDNTLHYSL